MPAPILRLSQAARIELTDSRVVIRVSDQGEDHREIANVFAGGGKCRLFRANRLTLIQLVEFKTDGGAAE